MDAADAANWRRENTLLLGMFVFLFSRCGSRFCDLRIHPVVGSVLPFSTSRQRKFFPWKRRDSRVSISPTINRYKGGGWEMMTDGVVVDVSQDWILACNVQQRFMQGSGRNNGSAALSGRCRQVRALGGDCYDFMRLTDKLGGGHWRCLRQRSGGGAHDRQCAVLASDSGIVYGKRPGCFAQGSEP
jgi:hypothetical protein